MIASLLALSLASPAQQPGGTYLGKSWSVSASRALIWDGAPFLPMGWRIGGSSESIKSAVATGLKDVLLDLRIGDNWQSAVANAEAAGMRYLVGIDETTPRAPAFLVDPSAYRIDKVPRTADYTIPIPYGRSVYYVLLTDPDFSIADKGFVEVSGGVAKVSVHETISGGGFVLLLYPRVDQSDLTDYWERFDKARDEVLGKLRGASLGPGLRGIVNPLGKPKMWTSYDGGYVPDSVMFRLEFESFLKSKYQNTAGVERAWRMTSPDLKSFEAAARLVPLFKGNRGVSALLDPTNGAMISVERSGCSYWRDLQTIIDNDAARRTSRLSLAVRQVADVPVLYEWTGWSPIYDTKEPSGQGIGMAAIGTGLDAIDNNAASAAATALSWGSLRWLVATDLRATPDGKPYAEERSLRSAISDTGELGAKGWFVKWSGGSESGWLKTIAEELSGDTKFANIVPSAIYYPENARHPATTMRLPGGVWWLPTPAPGDRLDVGQDYEAYRHSAKFAEFVAIWRLGAPAKTKLRLAYPERALLTRYDGTPVTAKVLKDGIELTIDNLPIIVRNTDEIPVPQDSIDAARADYFSLVAEAKKQSLDIGNDRFSFDDGVRSLDRNPGAAFAKMSEALHSIQAAVGAYTWVEGEVPSENTFGEVVVDAACSGSKALRLRTHLRPGPDGYYATYNLKIKVTEQDEDLWLAASVPEATRQFVTCEIAGLKIPLPKDPQSGYGASYAWYRLGKVPLKKGIHAITFRVSPSAPLYEMSVDAILATAQPFTPLGPRMPQYAPGG